MHPNSNEQDASVTSAGDSDKTTSNLNLNNPNDQGTTGRADRASEELNDRKELRAGEEQGTGEEHGAGDGGGFVNEHDDQSTGPNHNEQAKGTAVEAHELFTNEELAEVVRVLLSAGNTGIFQCSLTAVDQVIQLLVSTYGFTSPFNMGYIDTPTGKIPRDEVLEEIFKQ
ncbi:hypothetical protein PGT21_026504 [Puccinia graminis f. sp. tritici]|nr:hypothetical protein PGT21_026504 [Puccinia graminis f. sp. tritici]KAA1113832.1 hypothetical protein PGTUg99_025718 [Puccinia graminis f. sp. tritici]